MSHCQECTDDPWLNISSEEPDHDRFIKHGFFRDRSPLGWEWRSNGCLRICVSEVSQDEADDCALLQAKLCVLLDRRPPDGGPPFQPPALFVNDAVTCTIRCSDGASTTSTGQGTFSWTQAAGTVAALSQDEANFLAASMACARARQHRICISSALTGGCVNEVYRQQIRAVGGTPWVWPFVGLVPPFGCNADVAAGDRTSTAPIPYTWSLISGSLPPGLELRPCTGYIKGTPTTIGAYSFTIRATDAIGSFQNQSFTLTIAQISTEDPLPDMILGVDYLVNLAVAPAHDQETESWSVTAGELPPGIELSTAGVLSGVPEGEVVGYQFTVQVTFLPSGSSEYVQCTKEFHVSVATLPGYWKMDEVTGTREDSVGSAHLVVAGAVNPPGVAGLISNAVDLSSTFPATEIFNTGTPSGQLAFNTDGFTFSIWKRIIAAGTLNPRFQPFNIRFYDTASTLVGQWVVQFSSSSGFTLVLWTNHLTATTTSYTFTGVGAGMWRMMTLRYRPNGFCELIINATFPEEITPTSLIIPAHTQADIRIFVEHGFTGVAGEMYLDEMGYFNRQLTDAEITHLYNSGAGRTYPDVP